VLTSLSNIKALLNITDNSKDTLLTQLANACTGIIQRYCSLDFEVNTYSGAFNGTGNSSFEMPRYPIISVQSLTIFEQVINPAPDSLHTGYVFDKDMLYIQGGGSLIPPTYSFWDGVFTKGLQNIKVMWTAGYAAIPYELDWACAQLSAYKYRGLDRIGVKTHNLNGFETEGLITDEIPDEIKVIINRYRRTGAYAF
jgi:hypothetical protein